jgi:hypothetical protein
MRWPWNVKYASRAEAGALNAKSTIKQTIRFIKASPKNGTG